MGDILIVEPNEKDYDELFQVLKKIADESNEFSFTSSDIGMDEASFSQYVKRFAFYDNSIFVIAKVEDKIVGFAYLDGGKRERTYHNTNLGIGILEQYRGRKIGKLLLEYIMNFARNSEYIAKIDLQVRIDNTVAIKLYKSFKFNVEGVNKRALFVDGKFIDFANMGLLID